MKEVRVWTSVTVPDGWELVSDEMRSPKEGEYYVHDDELLQAHHDLKPFLVRPIVKKVECKLPIKIDFLKSAGKTIRAIDNVDDNELIVSFTDGTFSVLRAGYSDASISTDADFIGGIYSLEWLVVLFGQEQAEEVYQAGLREMERKAEKLRENRQREYERMKKEFG